LIEPDIIHSQAVDIARRVREGELRAEEAVGAFLERARARREWGAFLSLREDAALAEARAVDEKRRRGGRLGRLAGVAVAVKDNILVAGAPATCGSRILEGYRAPYSATAVERVMAEDGVVLGKTNMDEFGMGSSTENSAFGPARNPWDAGRVPGGSSGGSAAAVAAGLAPLALGTDTGGSIRQPAAFCGLVGLKPSYGTVSRYGLTAYASSLDQAGPLARSAEDAALCLSVIAGHDPRDATSLRGTARDYLAESAGGLPAGLRLALPREYFQEGLDPEVEAAVRGAADAFAELGARLGAASLPHTRHALSAYYLVATCEASSNLARFDGVRFGTRAAGEGPRTLLGMYEASRGRGLGPEVKRRIMLGTFALSAGYYEAYYLRAQKARARVRADFAAAFAQADLLLAPTAPTAAFALGEKTQDPLQMYLSDVYTVPCSLAGGAAVSIPCGRTRAGGPIGLQLMAPPGGEGLLLRAARAFLAARPFPECPALNAAAGPALGGLP